MLKLVVTLLIVGGIFFITNTNGFLFTHTEKCQIALYKGGKDFGGEKIMANKSFIPHLKSIGAVAKACKVKVHVTDSYKQLKSPTEHVLHSKMPLALGRGINFDLQNQNGGVLCNTLCMTSHSWKTLPDAACFINGVQKKGVKFTQPNILDDGYAAKLSTTDADKLKTATQTLCAPKTKGAKG
jgi:hypothetical protein